MKIETLIVVTACGLFGFVCLPFVIGRGCQPEPGNHEDNRATRTIYASVLETGVVERVLSSYEGVRLVRVGYGNTNDDFARYALTMDWNITNGTLVKLVQMSHDDSTASMHGSSPFRYNSRLAVRIK